MEAEDPRYKIRLENGATFWTDTHESWLRSQWATGPGTQFAADPDDPFADLRGDTSLRVGSYGIHAIHNGKPWRGWTRQRHMLRPSRPMTQRNRYICRTIGL